MDLAQDTTVVDHWKLVVRLESKHFDKYNQILYTSLHIVITNYGLRYCDKHETRKNLRAAWRDLLDYYYGSINNENKVMKIERKIKRASYFEEESGLNYEEYTGNLRTILQQLTKIGSPLHP